MSRTCHNILFFLVIVFSLFVTGCKKSDSPQPLPPDPPGPPPVTPVVFVDQKVTASLQGKVMDESGKALANATIKAGGITSISDVNGMFRFNNIQLGKNAGYVSVEKDGYLKTGRTIMTSAGVLNYVEIQLIPKIDRGNFSSSAGGTVNIENGSSINFGANSIMSIATNSAYGGTVNVKGIYPELSDPEFSIIMPGSLLGLNLKEELKHLRVFGMLAIELEAGASEKLNIINGKSTTLTMPIAATMLVAAPDSIPLWYFNDTTGLWKEQGFARKQGNNYVGNVSHFSFWLAALPGNFFTIKMKLNDQQNSLLPYYKVQLINPDIVTAISEFTDSTGSANFPVPENNVLQMKVFDRCTNLIHAQNIGPFSSNTNLGSISIATVATDSIRITGEVMNCSLLPVVNGEVDIKLEGTNYKANINNGSFSFATFRKNCDGSEVTAKVLARDLTTNKQTTLTTIDVYPGNNSMPAIFACEENADFHVTYLVNDTGYVNFLTPAYNLSYTMATGETYMHIDNISNTSSNETGFQITGRPDTPAYTTGVWDGYVSLNVGGVQYASTAPILINIRKHDFLGPGFLSGSFSGILTDNTPAKKTIKVKCDFKIKADL